MNDPRNPFCTSQWWRGKTLVVRQAISTGRSRIQTGRPVTVLQKYKGLEIRTDYCVHCGTAWHVTCLALRAGPAPRVGAWYPTTTKRVYEAGKHSRAGAGRDREANRIADLPSVMWVRPPFTKKHATEFPEVGKEKSCVVHAQFPGLCQGFPGPAS